MNDRPIASVATVATEPLLALQDVHQAYGELQVVRGLSFNLLRGSIGCLLGPSGCGKTTVLRCIAGFEAVRDGEIWLNGQLVSSAFARVPPERRRIGMVFQDYALFPHLSVARNVAFGLHALPESEQTRRAGECIEAVGLSGLAGKYPHELSGGQQQRIALARALAPRPDLLLLDEPFSNLDVDFRAKLRVGGRGSITQQNTTAILVADGGQEAFSLADEVGFMLDGAIEQWDTPYRLYHEPVTRYVA